MFLLLSLLSVPAPAVQYNGTPVLTWRVDRPAHDYVGGSVTLTGVRVHHCGGGHTDVASGASVDPTEAQTLSIPSGDHCGLTFFWGTDLDLDGPSYTVRYAENSTSVVLDSPIDPVYLSPYEVVSGSMSGYGPWLVLEIE